MTVSRHKTNSYGKFARDKLLNPRSFPIVEAYSFLRISVIFDGTFSTYRMANRNPANHSSTPEPRDRAAAGQVHDLMVTFLATT